MRPTLPKAFFRKLAVFGSLLSGACSFEPGSLASGDAIDAGDAPPGDGSSDATTIDGTVTVAPIEIDAVTNARGAYALVNSHSHTVGAGSDRFLLVGVSTSYAGTLVSSILYGTMPLTFVGAYNAISDDGRVELWQLVAPPVGTANITVTVDDQSSEYIVGATSLRNVNQTTPLGAFTTDRATTGNPSLSVAAGADDLVLAVLMWNGAYETLQPGSGQDQRWYRTGNDLIGTGSFKAGATSTTFSWSATNALVDYWAVGGVAIRR